MTTKKGPLNKQRLQGCFIVFDQRGRLQDLLRQRKNNTTVEKSHSRNEAQETQDESARLPEIKIN